MFWLLMNIDEYLKVLKGEFQGLTLLETVATYLLLSNALYIHFHRTFRKLEKFVFLLNMNEQLGLNKKFQILLFWKRRKLLSIAL